VVHLKADYLHNAVAAGSPCRVPAHYSCCWTPWKAEQLTYTL